MRLSIKFCDQESGCFYSLHIILKLSCIGEDFQQHLPDDSVIPNISGLHISLTQIFLSETECTIFFIMLQNSEFLDQKSFEIWKPASEEKLCLQVYTVILKYFISSKVLSCFWLDLLMLQIVQAALLTMYKDFIKIVLYITSSIFHIALLHLPLIINLSYFCFFL